VVATVPEQEAQGRCGRRVGDALPVVDHQGDAIVFLMYLVDQRCQHVPRRVIPVLLEHLAQ